MNKNVLRFHHELCTHMQCGQCGAIHEEIIPLNGFFFNWSKRLTKLNCTSFGTTLYKKVIMSAHCAQKYPPVTSHYSSE